MEREKAWAPFVSGAVKWQLKEFVDYEKPSVGSTVNCHLTLTRPRRSAPGQMYSAVEWRSQRATLKAAEGATRSQQPSPGGFAGARSAPLCHTKAAPEGGWRGGKAELSGHQPSGQNSAGGSVQRGGWDRPLWAQSGLARAPPGLDANAGIVTAALCLPCRSVPAPGSFS